MKKIPNVYFFGAYRFGGAHELYLFNSPITRAEQKELPEKLNSYNLDKPERTSGKQSQITRWECEGYTIISMYDLSGTGRGGSHSNFFLKGSYTTEEMIKLFFTHYPDQANRINSAKAFFE